MKVLNKLRQGQSPCQTAAALRREVSTLEALQGETKHIVESLGVFEDTASVYVVMEKLEGGSLHDLMKQRNGVLSEEEITWIAADILGFLSACHSNGIFYADVKPANFMLHNDSAEGRWIVKAIDMGCSERVRDGKTVPVRRGTPLFMAPEVVRRQCCMQSDVWSVGVMLFLMLTGRSPWHESLAGITPEQMIKTIALADVVYRDEDWSTVNPAARDLVEKMLNKEPRKRITAEQALYHPWLSGNEGDFLVNNIIPLKKSPSTSKMKNDVVA